ncbi:MAG: toll/interleukin-1 receptor domain-containing protein [Planctomycetota bacterium]
MTEPRHDVFLSYSIADARFARSVANSLRAAGILVFDPVALRAGGNLQQAVMRAIAESAAVVAVLSNRASAPSIGVEIGAAWAWRKPIFIIREDENDLRSPWALPDLRVYSASAIDDLAHAIRQGMQPLLSEQEQESLVAAYSTLNVPTDQLLSRPAAIDELAAAFSRRGGRQIAGERLVQELIRLRKQGALPRLRNIG